MTMARYWDYQAAARANHAEERYIASWLNLLEGELAKDEQENRWRNKKPASHRQKEIQRLWQQRGLLERTKANIRSVMEIKEYHNIHKRLLNEAWHEIVELIGANKRLVGTVKERISND